MLHLTSQDNTQQHMGVCSDLEVHLSQLVWCGKRRYSGQVQ